MHDEDREDEEGSKRVSRRGFVKGAIVGTVALSLGCGESMTGGDAGSATDAGARMDAGPGDEPDAGGDDAGTDAGPEPVPPPEDVDESTDDFPLGVASGDVTSSAAILWTRYAGDATVELVVWRMDGDTYGPTAFVGEVTPADGYAHVDVDTLEPGARYRYAFFVVEGGERTARSAIGRFRAAIAPDAMESLWIGAVSCTNNSRSLATLGQAAARDDLDVFLYLGDTTYNDSATSLEDYRDAWSGQMGRDEYKALRASVSALATWDDHEFDNNWDPETFDADRRAAAVDTFFEHQPLRRDPANPERVWKVMSWGRTVDIFVLDCRAERMPSTRGDADVYVSRLQMDWLKAGLSASTAVFKLIVNSVPITDFPGAFDLQPQDRWEGYPAQRDEILSHIDDEAISGVLWVAGDFHLASSQRVSTSGPGSTQNEILVGPGAQFGNPLGLTLGGEQFDFGSTTNNFTALELLPAMGRIRAHWIDGDGSAFEVHEYDVG